MRICSLYRRTPVLYTLLYTSTSAILYSSALLMPEYCWWGVFIFLLPLYHLYFSLEYTINRTHGFLYGFLWGIIVFGSITYSMARTSIYYSLSVTYNYYTLTCAFVCTILFIIYCACYSALWFCITEYVIKYGKKYKNITRPSLSLSLLITSITTVVYITYIDRWCLWPLLRIEGHPLLHPLIALSEQPHLLFLLSYTGKQILTIALLAPASTFFYCWHTRSRRMLCILACTFMPWLMPYAIRVASAETREIPPYISEIAWLPLHSTGTNSLSIARVAHYAFKKIISRNSAIQTIILPESAFSNKYVCSDMSCTQLWDNAHLGKELTILCGSFSSTIDINRDTLTQDHNNNSCYNTCYILYNGVVIHRYHKKHTMPLFEQLPSWVPSILYNRLYATFFSATPPIIGSINTRKPIPLTRTHKCVPYICSELFFSQYPDADPDMITSYPVLALISDSWTQSRAIHDLMFRLAQIKAIEWQRDIIYISYTRAAYINKYGYWVSLCALSTP